MCSLREYVEELVKHYDLSNEERQKLLDMVWDEEVDERDLVDKVMEFDA